MPTHLFLPLLGERLPPLLQLRDGRRRRHIGRRRARRRLGRHARFFRGARFFSGARFFAVRGAFNGRAGHDRIRRIGIGRAIVVGRGFTRRRADQRTRKLQRLDLAAVRRGEEGKTRRVW